jgi:DNA primase
LLEAEWGLLGTGPLGEHKFRIVIPVEQGGRQVCYQTRDVTGRAKAKYLSCHDADAVVPLKSCLYGLDKCAGNNWVVITEGPTKVWRLGTGAVATFGATVSDEQVAALTRFERRVIIFDHDEAGMDGAARLANQLAVFGGQTEALWIQGVRDVAEVNDGDALRLMRHVAENK